jgi:predicted nucleotidyltransferase
VYGRSPENVTRLAQALAPYQPYLRGAPEGLPFVLDSATILRGLNFTLTTTIGDIDLLGEVTGGGRFEQLVARAEPLELEGRHCLVVTLETLIALKRAAGRAKDREALAELEALLEERNR